MTEAHREAPPAKQPKVPQALRGFHDTLPADEPAWDFLFNAFRSLARSYGCGRIEVPTLEAASLFSRAVGRDTEVIEKELFSFRDRSDDEVAMRPEATAGVVRAYVEHGMVSLPKPVKLWYWAPMFRYDRPQAGRFREFWQYGVEFLGDDEPVLDAQAILLATRLATTVGVPTVVQINSIGCVQCRPRYVKALADYFRPHRASLGEVGQRQLQRAPLRLLDSKNPALVELGAEAPQFVDHLCEACNAHLVKVLEYLDEVEVAYSLNHRIVRGLDYYTRTVFEVFAPGEEEGSQTALSGGGRYDGLVQLLGGQPTPAVGFAGGVERLISTLQARGLTPPKLLEPQVMLAQLGEEARRTALSLFERLREAGVHVVERFGRGGLKGQLEEANRLGVRYAVIIGQREIIDGTVLLRDMENGIQEVIDRQRLPVEVVKRLAKQTERHSGGHGSAAGGVVSSELPTAPHGAPVTHP